MFLGSFIDLRNKSERDKSVKGRILAKIGAADGTIFISISVPGWILAFDGDEDLTIMEAPNAEDTGDRDTGDRDTGVPG